jgi:hypothetical protein
MLDSPRKGILAAAVIASGALGPSLACAQTAPTTPTAQTWRYTASIYVYLPSVGGSTAFPADGNGNPININADQILDHLKMAAMGSFEAHNGSWGIFTDVVYLNFGASKSNSGDFTIGSVGLPAGTAADLDWSLAGYVWTLVGGYRLPSPDPALTVDVLAGARMFDLQQQLRWNISGSLGPIDPAARSGSSEVGDTVWDAIVGVKGRYVFGGNRQWAVPFYLDVGTGQSTNTVQAAAGISHAFQWGELNALWRYLGYKAKEGRAISEVSFSGPQVGAAFRW